MPSFKVGKITHYYDKLGVAVVELTGTLGIGDEIKISGDEVEFRQTVQSMQVEHEQIDVAKKGMTVGLKVDQPAKRNQLVYKIE
jgi:putative protease